MKEGHDFSRDIASDTSGFIINEAAARYLGFANPIGETLKWGKNGEWKIIGIANDMVTQSPFGAVNPMIVFLRSNRISWIKFDAVNLRLKPTASLPAALDKIAPLFKRYDPEKAFEYSFADQAFGTKFDSERRVANLASVSTALAIFISCLGLLGLSAFMAAQRTREIGIRKVMGASTVQLCEIMSKEFVVLVVIACAISIPLATYFMSDWLSQYEYRVGISWTVYALACAGAIAISLATVSFQSIKTALGNPVNALRNE
jgi:ABC-type antimicrobial peptide transport system permease subunit